MDGHLLLPPVALGARDDYPPPLAGRRPGSLLCFRVIAPVRAGAGSPVFGTGRGHGCVQHGTKAPQITQDRCLRSRKRSVYESRLARLRDPPVMLGPNSAEGCTCPSLFLVMMSRKDWSASSLPRMDSGPMSPSIGVPRAAVPVAPLTPASGAPSSPPLSVNTGPVKTRCGSGPHVSSDRDKPPC